MGKKAIKHIQKDATFTTKALVVSAAAGIPVVGSQISTAISIWEGERISRRVETFVAEVGARFSKLESEGLDRGYINSEAFQDVVIAALQAAKRSSGNGKRAWVASVLIGAATLNRPPDLDAEAILDMLGLLTERELGILAWAWTNSQVTGEFFSGALPRNLTGPDYSFHMVRLESAGMIAYRADVPIMGGYDYRMFRPTNTFRRLMTMIDATGGINPKPGP